MKRRLKRGYFRKKKYVWYYENCPVEDKVILLESQHGKSFGGNIFAIAKELSENAEYKDLSCLQPQSIWSMTILLSIFLSSVRNRYI